MTSRQITTTLEETWRTHRRRIDVLLADPEFHSGQFLTGFKSAYYHATPEDPDTFNDMYQAAMQDMLTCYQEVQKRCEILAELHLLRDHSDPATSVAYPQDAAYFLLDLRNLLERMEIHGTALRTHVSREHQPKMDGPFASLSTIATSLIEALEESNAAAKRMNAAQSGDTAKGIKLGYKHTKIGMIPKDWETSKLIDLARQITDGDHATPKRESHGYYLLSARNILNGKLDVKDVDYVGTVEYRRMKQRCSPETGDILISCSGTIGRVAIVPLNFECVLVRSAALTKVDQGLADSLFLQFWLQSKNAQEQMAASVNQGAQPNLFLNQIERLTCPQPPLPEQRAIAEVLGDVDGLLGALDRLIAKKRDLKQAAMQQLLTGQTRLPGFKGQWMAKQLGEIGIFLKGSGVKKDEAQSGSLPCIRYGEIYTTHNDIIRKFRSFISEEVAAAAQLLKNGDLLFAGSGETKEEIGKCVAFVNQGEAYAGGDIVILRPHSADSKFLGYALNSPAIGRQKASRGQGDAVVHIGSSALAQVEVNIPPLLEQTAIAEVLNDMDAEITALEARREKTRALKKGVTQELLTGKTRLV